MASVLVETGKVAHSVDKICSQPTTETKGLGVGEFWGELMGIVHC